MSIESKLKEFQALPVDWDSYGGLPTTAIAAKLALKLIEALSESVAMCDDPDYRSFGPTSDGGVRWECDVDDGTIIVEIEPTGQLSAEFLENEP